jgi:hypothetical protein
MLFLRMFFLMAAVGLVLAASDAIAAKSSDTRNVESDRGIPASPDTSSPDDWGYTWVRSTDPGGPTFNWVDITQIGTRLQNVGDDVNLGPFPIGFEFPYYWYSASTFRIGSNGYIVLRNDPTNWSSTFGPIPSVASSVPKDLVAPLAGDLDPSRPTGGNGIWYWSNNVDSLVVSFINITEWRNPADTNQKHTFQVILNKQDSSIIFQYGRQQGQYSATNNNELIIGIQNQSGQIGLLYTYSNTPPHAMMPDSGLVIRIKRTENTGLQVTDAGVLGGFNHQNLGKVVRLGVSDTIRAVVKNFGTVDLSNVRLTYAISRSGQPTAYDTVFISSMTASAESTVAFPRLFTPAVAGSYSAAFNTFVAGDQGPGNNSRTAELVSANFTAGQRTMVAYETNVQGGSISWTGGGGFGVHYELPVPVVVDSVYFRTTTAASVQVEILEDSSGFPGAVRATRTVTSLAGVLTGVSFLADSASLSFPDGKFFIGARGSVAFSYETSQPISFRTWEYTNGYAPYRTRDQQDIIMRATVRTTGGGAPAINISPTSITRSLDEGDSVDVSITIRNTGSAPLAWSANSSTSAISKSNAGGETVPQTKQETGYRHERAQETLSYALNPEVTYGPELDGPLTVIDESFEGTTFPPAGWLKLSPDGGTGWNRQVSGTTPVPGWNGGTITVPTGGGSAVAFATWTTGGASSNDQWLVTPQITNVGAGDSLKFYLRYWPNNYADTLEVRISTSSPTIGNFNILVARLAFAVSPTTDTNWTQYGYRLANYVTPGSNIYVAFRERVLNNINDGASFSLDLVRTTQGTAPVEWLRLVGATSGSIAAGDSATLTARLYGRTAAAMLLDTAFSGNIAITSNDPSNPTVNIPVNLTVVTDVASGDGTFPETFVLHQNYPNPFNPSTTISFALPRETNMSLKVYNLLGQEVATLVSGVQKPGEHEVHWNASGFPSGIYFYKLEAGEFVQSRKLVLLK